MILNKRFQFKICFCVLALCGLYYSSCTNSKDESTKNNKEIFSKLIKQKYLIKTEKDTVLLGSAGTALYISKNTFIDSLGKLIVGEVVVELIEANTPPEIVLGNLSTVSNGNFLQTGGMLYINATLNGNQLNIESNKDILVNQPTDSVIDNMSQYDGVINSSGINWSNPKKLRKKYLNSKRRIKTAGATNVSYSVPSLYENVKVGDYNNVKYPKGLREKIDELIYSGNGLIISNDSVVKIDGYNVNLYKGELRSYNDINIIDVEDGEVINGFEIDTKTSYCFPITKLGWVNIDRLFHDPRTKKVEFITKINDDAEFTKVYITLVTERMYIPGYQMKNEDYSFTHSDGEKPMLPIGASAVVIAIAYKDEKPFYSLQKLIISENQTISLNLRETSMDSLRQILKTNL